VTGPSTSARTTDVVSVADGTDDLASMWLAVVMLAVDLIAATQRPLLITRSARSSMNAGATVRTFGGADWWVTVLTGEGDITVLLEPSPWDPWCETASTYASCLTRCDCTCKRCCVAAAVVAVEGSPCKRLLAA
jgi:hypothetical protein